ncbi:MAG: type II toxin-antitoxin system VapC family toxin [Nitrospirae bacterium]|nr:type II toxin-antitoxin system VapC family toxin [Nitrospirota bacterium]MDA1304568.1 type II toxin-antitoxin system VapC family toxin [Nitrospirota bacterium]
MIVSDTNLIVYLYVKGQRTNQAEAVLLKDPTWVAPMLWRSEFRNTLLGLVRRKDLTLDEVLEIMNDAEQWMMGREYTVVSIKVLQLAEQSGCSAYDCEFASLAMDLEVPLVTSDRQLLRAFPGVAVSPEGFVK